MSNISPHSKEYSELRKWLKGAREDRGLSIRAAAKVSGVQHSVLGKIEASDRKLEIFEFIDYCLSLGVSPEEGFDVALKAYKEAHRIK